MIGEGKSQKTVYIFRHGATLWTQSKQHTSVTDIPLVKEGVKEAKHLRKFITKNDLQFSHILCSPLQRAQQTAKLAGFDQVLLDEDLLEWNYGDYEGKTTKEIQQTDPDWTIFQKDPPNGETQQQIEKRVDRLILRVQSLEGNCIALFSSGHISRAIGARWLQMPVSFGQHLSLSTASTSILGFEHAHPVLLAWNITSYL